jgi:hypothetical protein
MAILLQVIEKRQNHFWGNVCKRHRGRRFAAVAGSEVQKEHERIAVCSHGARAQRSLLGQVFGKELL